jgi:hypothetical protein
MESDKISIVLCRQLQEGDLIDLADFKARPGFCVKSKGRGRFQGRGNDGELLIICD